MWYQTQNNQGIMCDLYLSYVKQQDVLGSSGEAR